MSLIPPGLSVLHVTQPVEGGVARCVRELVGDQAARRGWTVAVASPHHDRLIHDLTAAGASHFSWPATRDPGPNVFRETRALRELVADLTPDVVHLHSSKAGLAGRLAVRGRMPTVFQPHGWSFYALNPSVRPLAVAWERAAARWADRVICVSDDERARGEHERISANWGVVRNGIDPTTFPPVGRTARDDARGRLALGPEPLAVCLGRLSPAKGQDLLVEVWREVRHELATARLVLVGDGPMRQLLVERLVNVDGVTMVGHQEDVQDWLVAANVVVLASRWEGMSYAMLEAMACGRSVVTTDVAGARESVDEVAGAVVPQGDLQGLAQALVERLSAPSIADAEGAAGRDRVEKHFTAQRMADSIAALYRDSVSSRAARS